MKSLIRRKSSLSEQFSSRCSFHRDPLLLCIGSFEIVDNSITRVHVEALNFLEYLNFENPALRDIYVRVKKSLVNHHKDSSNCFEFGKLLETIQDGVNSKFDFTTLEKLELIRVALLIAIFGNLANADQMYRSICEWLEQVKLLIRKADDSVSWIQNGGRRLSLPNKKEVILNNVPL